MALPGREDDVEIAAVVDTALGLSRSENEFATIPAGDVRADLTRELLLNILAHTFAASDGQMLILDDAQWIDSASWALLNDARQEIKPLLTVVATRPMPESTLVPKEYKAILADPDTGRIQLSTLAPEESIAMVAQHLGVTGLPDAVADFILQRSEGHPFFSEEIAYALIDAGILQVRDNESILVTQNGGLEKMDFPVTVQGVITSRIDRLDAPTQLTVKVASVIGQTFSFENLYDVHPVAGDKENLHLHLGELARLDIVVIDTSTAGANYVFKHTTIQETAYSRLLITQKQQLHRAVAEWLEKTYTANIAPFYPLLAHHWGTAAAARKGASQDQQLITKALHYTEESGEQALQNSAYREAINFFSEALTLKAGQALEVSPEREANWLQQMGEAYHQWGQWSVARDRLAQAAAMYGRPVPSGRAGVIAGIFWQFLKQVRNRLWPSRYVGTAPQSQRQASRKVAHIYQSLSEVTYLTNETAFSFYAILYALNLSEHGGLSPELVRAYKDICVIVGLFGPRGMAEAYGDRAWSTAQALDDPAAKADAKLGIGLYLLNAGELDQAQTNLRQALEISEELDDLRLWGDSLGILARTIRFRGELGRARDLYVELGGPRSGIMMHRIWALNSQSIIALRQDRPDEALILLEQARTLPGESSEPQQEIVTLGYLGKAHLRMGDQLLARETADMAVALMDRTKASAYTHFEAFAAVSEVYLALWESEHDPTLSKEGEYAVAARRLCRSLQRATIPIGRPAAWLYQGWYDWLAGHQGRAFKQWEKGLRAAEEVGMPYELGRIHNEIGRHSPPDDPKRREHLRQACEIFDQIGAFHQLELTQAALDSSPSQ